MGISNVAYWRLDSKFPRRSSRTTAKAGKKPAASMERMPRMYFITNR